MKSIFFDEIDNTQDFAINEFKKEPLLIVSKVQTSGRGTNQNKWQNADQSLATSLVCLIKKLLVLLRHLSRYWLVTHMYL